MFLDSHMSIRTLPRNPFPDQVPVLTTKDDNVNDVHIMVKRAVEIALGPAILETRKFRKEIVFDLCVAVSTKACFSPSPTAAG
jgi:hypothetical protein